VSGRRRIAYRAGVARRGRIAPGCGATVWMQLRWSALIAGATFFLYSARAHR